MATLFYYGAKGVDKVKKVGGVIQSSQAVLKYQIP